MAGSRQAGQSLVADSVFFCAGGINPRPPRFQTMPEADEVAVENRQDRAQPSGLNVEGRSKSTSCPNLDLLVD